MSKDVTAFAKMMSGISTAEYVINYIDQHMLLCGLLDQLESQISVYTKNQTAIVYKLDKLTELEKGKANRIKNYIQNNPILKIYNMNYSVSIPDINKEDDDCLMILIQQC